MVLSNPTTNGTGFGNYGSSIAVSDKNARSQVFAATTRVCRKRQILYESFTVLTGFRTNVLENCLVDLQVSSVMATC